MYHCVIISFVCSAYIFNAFLLPRLARDFFRKYIQGGQMKISEIEEGQTALFILVRGRWGGETSFFRGGCSHMFTRWH